MWPHPLLFKSAQRSSKDLVEAIIPFMNCFSFPPKVMFSIRFNILCKAATCSSSCIPSPFFNLLVLLCWNLESKTSNQLSMVRMRYELPLVQFSSFTEGISYTVAQKLHSRLHSLSLTPNTVEMIIGYLVKLGYFALPRILIEKILQARFANFGYPAILMGPFCSRVKDMIAK